MVIDFQRISTGLVSCLFYNNLFVLLASIFIFFHPLHHHWTWYYEVKWNANVSWKTTSINRLKFASLAFKSVVCIYTWRDVEVYRKIDYEQLLFLLKESTEWVWSGTGLQAPQFAK